jgi:hypothetical protein
MAKVTVNIPDAYYEASKRIAARDHTNVSALTARALRRELLRADAAALVADGHTGSADMTDLADEARSA